MLNFFNKLIIRLSFLFFILIAGFSFIFFMVQDEIKNITFLDNYKPSVSSFVYDRDLQKTSELFWEKRYFIPIQKIPEKLIHAFIAAEDKSFFSHIGVDVLGMARAVFENTARGQWKKRPVGASTITQQVAKNMIVGNKHSLERKIHEAVAAFAIEYTLSKDRILEIYLNEIFLGNKAYGVASAALTYFNKPVEELSISECAYLASLPKAPGNFSLLAYKDRILERKNWVLKRMFEDGYITSKQLDQALNDELENIAIYQKKKAKLDYFSEHVRREILDKFGEETLYSKGLYIKTTQDAQLQKISERQLKKHLLDMDKQQGYRGAVLSIDLENGKMPSLKEYNWKISELCESLKLLKEDDADSAWEFAMVISVQGEKTVHIGTKDGKVLLLDEVSSHWVKRIPGEQDRLFLTDVFSVGDVVYIERKKNKAILQQIPEITGGLVILDPETGEILSLVGGYNAFLSHFNSATQAKRQPGSCFKPFVYMAALENGFTENSIIEDSPIEIYLGPGQGYYRPQNITRVSYGPTVLHLGLELSRNQMTVNLAHKVGIRSVGDLAKRFGIYQHMICELSASLGSVETTLLDLANAYAMVANRGKKIVPYSVTYILDQKGEAIYDVALDILPLEKEEDKEELPAFFDNRELITPLNVTSDMIKFLGRAVEYGTAKRLKDISEKRGIRFHAKTGTTNDCKDGWCIGFTQGLKRNLVIGVFVGYPIPKSMGDIATGARTALPLVKNMLANIPKEYIAKA